MGTITFYVLTIINILVLFFYFNSEYKARLECPETSRPPYQTPSPLEAQPDFIFEPLEEETDSETILNLKSTESEKIHNKDTNSSDRIPHNKEVNS